MKSICERCKHDDKIYGCEYQCVGVTKYSKKYEVATACEDYEKEDA